MEPSIGIILNPFSKSGKGKSWAKELSYSFPKAEIILTTRPGDGKFFATQLAKKGIEIIIAAGGDGTVNEVVNGIAGTPSCLGILPCGTVNVLALELKIPFDLSQACAIIRKNQTETIDLIKIDFHDFEEKARSCFAVQLAGIGFDAEVIRHVTKKQKMFLGKWSYLLQALKQTWSAQPLLDLQLPDSTLLQTSFVLIGNGKYYGGPFTVFPKASMQDNLLDLCLFDLKDSKSLWRYLFALPQNKLPSTSGIRHFQARSVEIKSKNKVALEIDGEWIGYTPCSFKTIPQHLKVLVP